MTRAVKSKKNRKAYRFFTSISEDEKSDAVSATTQAHNLKEAKENFEAALGRKIKTIDIDRE